MIKFNEVTWYSKLLALVVFLAVIPSISFYIGIAYNQAQSASDIFIPNEVVALGSVTNKETAKFQPHYVGWYGTYNFTETTPTAGNNAHLLWSYDLSISSRNGDAQWVLALNVDGFQTLLRVNATANNVGDSLDVVFDSYAEFNNNVQYGFKKGDVLFRLTPATNGKDLVITWNRMKPNLETSLGGAVFTKIKE